MAVCKKCGKEIPDDTNFCKNCGEPTENAPKQENPVSNGETAAKNTSSELTFSELIGSIVVIIIVVFVFRSCAKNGGSTTVGSYGYNYYSYQSAIRAFSSALKNADGEELKNCMFTPEMAEHKGEQYFIEWETNWKNTNAIAEAIMEEKSSYKIKVKDKTAIKGENLNSLQYEYSYNHLDKQIEKAYYISAEINMFGEYEPIGFYVVEIEDNGWKVHPDALKTVSGGATGVSGFGSYNDAVIP